MLEEIKAIVEISDEELEDIAGGKSEKKKATKSKYKCIECQMGKNIGEADYCSYIYQAHGHEGYCKNGHHWRVVGSVYDTYDPVGAQRWFAEN